MMYYTFIYTTLRYYNDVEGRFYGFIFGCIFWFTIERHHTVFYPTLSLRAISLYKRYNHNNYIIIIF